LISHGGDPLYIDLVGQQLETEARPLDPGAPHSQSRGRRAPNIVPFTTTLKPLRHPWYLPCRAVGEFAVALVLMILTAPLILLSALLVRLTSRGPAFYTQTRIGRNGRLFTIYKIRTMVHECESLTGPRWSMPEDPRVTRVGYFLRRTHLDELPQLINVLRGDMGLIGPRPERPEFLPKLERAVPCYRERLAIRPGITGLAQVHLAPDTDVESVRRKLAYDLYYIQCVDPWLDLRILLATGFYILGNPAQLARKTAATPLDESIEPAPVIAESEGEVFPERICA
jgi:lipopolysaccharide/colanic/teichoic acid biosynthesis glycosyltransferase